MVLTTYIFDIRQDRDGRVRRSARFAALGVIVLLGAALALSGCSKTSDKSTSSSSASKDSTGQVGANMAGAVQNVYIPQSAVNAKPTPWDLSTPESAVRSYLAWTSYAYRIAASDVATPTMGGDQGVRVDSYIQLNLQQGRIIDQHIESLTFGTASKSATSTLLPAKEKWTYSYVSIAKDNKSLGGPYTASYDTTYTLTKTSKGWVVSAIAVKANGTIK